MGSNPSTIYWMDIFSHIFVVKIVMFVWKDENKLKRGQGLAIFYSSTQGGPTYYLGRQVQEALLKHQLSIVYTKSSQFPWRIQVSLKFLLTNLHVAQVDWPNYVLTDHCALIGILHLPRLMKPHIWLTSIWSIRFGDTISVNIIRWTWIPPFPYY